MTGAQTHFFNEGTIEFLPPEYAKARHNTIRRFLVSEHTMPLACKHTSYENDGFLLHSSMVSKREAVFKSMAGVTSICCFLDGKNLAELCFLYQNYRETQEV